jgi:hypothetical protein
LAGISGVTTRFRGPALVLLSLLAAAAAAPSRAEPPLRFGTIRIRSLNVFSPEEAERGWIYRFADSLRFTTRESVIRRFLLFREGEPYNTTRIEESERNLRALPFIKNASITVYPPRNGAVDVEVITQDAWTTEPGFQLSGRSSTPASARSARAAQPMVSVMKRSRSKAASPSVRPRYARKRPSGDHTGKSAA